jgi:hypothetical protein
MNRGELRRIMVCDCMADDAGHLSERIRRLLEVRTADPERGLLTEMEHTLTDGYARALELERRAWRIETRIGTLAGEVESPVEAEELRGLAVRRRTTEDELARLRALLSDLRGRAEAVRAGPQRTTG